MAAGTRGFVLVERTLRRQTFGTLSTVADNGRPHATGVVYAVSPRGEPLMLYVTTRTTTRRCEIFAPILTWRSRFRLLDGFSLVFHLAPFSFRARRRLSQVRTMVRCKRSIRHGFSAESW